VKPANSVLSGYGTSVFEVMARLAREHGAINLGQGAPDRDGPADVIAAAAAALTEHSNQYPPLLGLPELREALAAHDERFYGLGLDPAREIMITLGATEALAVALFTLVEPGDEVVLIEPLYDSYLPILRRAGGVPRIVRLEPPDWKLPGQALEAAFSPRTKMILLNTPMNPTAKVFTRDELAQVADLCRRFDAYAVCDEVYEHMVFDGAAHLPLLALSGMRERTVRIGSAGKIFPLTGWKVGFMIAAPDLLATLSKAHQFLAFTTPPNLQRAVAYGLGAHAENFAGMAREMEGKRDRLAAGLANLGFRVLPCSGTFFLSADFAPLGFDGDDDAFCRTITVEAGVSAVPVSAFYQGAGQPAGGPPASGVPRSLARFCFAKRDAVLDEAMSRLARWRERTLRARSSSTGARVAPSHSTDAES
jgi:aspartate/methionine/tyrosine aminotransferase